MWLTPDICTPTQFFGADRIFLFLELDIKAAIRLSTHIPETELKTMFPAAKLVKTCHVPGYEDRE